MSAIAKATEIIKRFEGYHRKLSNGNAKAYLCPAGRATIGWGVTVYPWGQAVQLGDIITREQAEEYLQDYINSRCTPVLGQIPLWFEMTDNQKAALYSFAYNTGEHFYQGKNRKTITELCDSPHRWTDRDYVRGVFLLYRNPGSAFEEGLKRRRTAEAELWLTEV